MNLREAATASAFTSVRISHVERVIQIRLKHKTLTQVESRFTLHSMTGFRLPSGAVQIERIAGFCNLRNSLQNYWIDRVEMIVDPDTGDIITDLAGWVARGGSNDGIQAAPYAQMPSHTPPLGRPSMPDGRQRSRVSKHIEQAIQFAMKAGLLSVAENLEDVRRSLPGEPAAQSF